MSTLEEDLNELISGKQVVFASSIRTLLEERARLVDGGWKNVGYLNEDDGFAPTFKQATLFSPEAERGDWFKGFEPFQNQFQDMVQTYAKNVNNLIGNIVVMSMGDTEKKRGVLVEYYDDHVTVSLTDDVPWRTLERRNHYGPIRPIGD